MHPGISFKQRVSENKILPLVGVHDIFSATIAAKHFEGVFCSGLSYAASSYGKPDVGFVNWRDMIDFSTRLRAIIPEKHIVKKDGIKIPKDIDHKKLSKGYNVPDSLVDLVNKGQKGFLALKIVEIIGEDEPYQLDPETIYFITNLLNETDLIKLRNKVLISALPQRV